MQDWKTIREFEGVKYVTLEEAEQVAAMVLSKSFQKELTDALGQISKATGEIEKSVKDFRKDSNLILG